MIVTQISPSADKRDKTRFSMSAAHDESENVECDYIGWAQKKAAVDENNLCWN